MLVPIMDLLDKTRTEMVNFYSSDRKTEILTLHNPSRNMLRRIMTEGGIEFLLLERRFSIDDQLSKFPYWYYILISTIFRKLVPVNVGAITSVIGIFVKRGVPPTVEYLKQVLQQQLRSYNEKRVFLGGRSEMIDPIHFTSG